MDWDDGGTELVEAYDYLFKFIVVGEAGTGKSCLLYQCIHERFKEGSAHTIGVEFSSRTLRIGDKSVKLQLWDTAGQERFRSVTRSYYRGAAGAILVYDVTSRSTFETLTKWLEDIRALASDHIEIVLVGNKIDLAEDREVETEEGERFARENDLTFIETSSLTGENAALPFVLAARNILAGIDRGSLDPDAAGSGISYGERQLRAVADTNTPRIFRRRRRDSISIREFVGAKERFYVPSEFKPAASAINSGTQKGLASE